MLIIVELLGADQSNPNIAVGGDELVIGSYS